MLALVVHLLRTSGIRVHAHLYDWIIRADTPDLCSAHTLETINILQSMGWTINWKNSTTLTRSRISGSAFRPQSGPSFSTQLISRASYPVCPCQPSCLPARLHLSTAEFLISPRLYTSMVGELPSSETGFAAIFATSSHRLVVEDCAENLPHKNKYSNLANERVESMNILVTGISDFYIYVAKHEFNQSTGSFLPKTVLFWVIL